MNIHYVISILFVIIAAGTWFTGAISQTIFKIIFAAAVGLALHFFLKGVIKNGSSPSR